MDVKRPESLKSLIKTSMGVPKHEGKVTLRCIQHEIDHLNGLFVDRVDNTLALTQELSKHGFSSQAVKPLI